MITTYFGCLRRLASSALAAVEAKSAPYMYARGFVRQGFNGVPEVVTVTDADRCRDPVVHH